MGQIYEALRRRLRPEDVAQIVLDELGPELTIPERRLLEKAATNSMKSGLHQLTSMSADFFAAVPPERRVAKAQELFDRAAALTAAECADIGRLKEFVKQLSAEIDKAIGRSSFKYDRLDRAARKAVGLDLSKRKYNRLFRFVARFEAAVERYRKELGFAELRQVAKNGMASRMSQADFAASGAASYFVAYFVARQNRRSEFTNTAQDRPFDEIAGMLLDRFRRAPNAAGWRIIARVMPDIEIISCLSDSEKLALFADWLSLLRQIAEAMKSIRVQSSFDRATMIVRRGDDSSSWNAATGAWNAARQAWLAVIVMLGMEDVLDLVCLGKAMRLMAADVARWHGGALHPDTAVWSALPPPWDVFDGKATCTRADIESACAEFGVDPVAGGWTAPRRARQAVAFAPTPELVQGVAVSHPELAVMLRKAGWFSGKPSRSLPDGVAVEVVRDETGAALSAHFVGDLEQPLDQQEPLIQPNQAARD